eukprot:SAG22_NODE_238_length_14184_cov_5.966844_7_plen_236_part_00
MRRLVYKAVVVAHLRRGGRGRRRILYCFEDPRWLPRTGPTGPSFRIGSVAARQPQRTEGLADGNGPPPAWFALARLSRTHTHTHHTHHITSFTRAHTHTNTHTTMIHNFGISEASSQPSAQQEPTKRSAPVREQWSDWRHMVPMRRQAGSRQELLAGSCLGQAVLSFRIIMGWFSLMWCSGWNNQSLCFVVIRKRAPASASKRTRRLAGRLAAGSSPRERGEGGVRAASNAPAGS